VRDLASLRAVIKRQERAPGEGCAEPGLRWGAHSHWARPLGETGDLGGGDQHRSKEPASSLAMATRPGPLTEWPWQRLGNFKVRKAASYQ